MLQFRTEVLAPADALSTLAELLGPAFEHIEHVRFVDYHDTSENMRFTIAVTHVRSSESARHAVYECAQECVEATGWYPLVQGERLFSRRSRTAFLRTYGRPVALPRIDGDIRAVAPAVAGGGGCSLRLQVGEHTILLDTGFPRRLTVRDTDRLALLTHTHADHAGGFLSGATGALPVVMSTATAQLLEALTRSARPRLREHAVLTEPGRTLDLGSGLSVRPFAVPHLPGAVGYEIRTTAMSVFFTGDICLRTARSDFVGELAARVRQSPARRRVVLLDATMAGRPLGATTANAAEALLDQADTTDDVVVTATGVDHLLYAYLDVFHTVQKSPQTRHSTSFVVTPRLRGVFETVHSAFIGREVETLDPFILGQYGRSMSSWGESRWLFWLAAQPDIPGEGRRIWFVRHAELDQVQPRGKAWLVHVGRGTAPQPAWDHATPDIDTRPWTLHSDESALHDMIQELAGDASVILFHNVEHQMSGFLTRHGLPGSALGTDPVRLA